MKHASSRLRITRRTSVSAAAALALALLTACGSNDASGTSDGPELSSKTLGILTYIEAVEGNSRPADATQEAAAHLGWKVERIDGQGDPATFTQAMNTFVQKKVDAAALMWVPANLVAPQLSQAKAQDMKVADLLSGPSDLEPWTDLSYEIDEMASLYVQAFAKFLPDGGKLFAIVDNNVDNPRELWAAVKRKLNAEHPDIEIVGEHQTDVQNLSNDAINSTKTALTKHPDLGCVFAVSDAQGIGVLSALESAGKPEVCVVSSNGQKELLDAIRDGRPVADVAIGFEQGGYQLVDVLLKQLAGDPVPDDHLTLPLQLIDSSNVPPAGESYRGEEGYADKYKAEWKKTYGLGS